MKKIRKSSVFHRRLNYNYPLITHGKGVYLFDKNGKKYIDGSGGPAVVNLGHGVKEIAEALKKSVLKFSYLYGSQFSTETMEDYAKELCSLAPGAFSRVFFVSGGSEAVETAVKLARQYHYDAGNPKKYKVISRYPGYHGNTIFTLSLSSKPNMRKRQGPLLFKSVSVPAPFCYRCPLDKTYPVCKMACAWELEKAIRKAGPETVSAFIAETIIGSTAPAVVPPKEYFPIIRKICDKYNVLLILDEIMAGFGRTGKWFAFQHFGVVPDIVTVGKGISGGVVPLAAVFSKERIIKAIQKGSGNFLHGFTFTNNPITTSVGKAVLDYMKKHGLVGQSEKQGKYLLKRLKTLQDLPMVGEVRGLGLMVGFELVKNKKTKETFPRSMEISEKVINAALKRGLNLLFGTGFTKNGQGDAVMVTPPFIISKKEIDKIVEILRASIKEVQKSL